MYFNFYAKKKLTAILQMALERYTNFFGMIIWRVFSVDVTNFWIDIYEEVPGGEPKLVSAWGHKTLPRYDHVAEAITVTSVFTTLKYYPSNSAIFNQRLMRYARTVPRTRPDAAVLFRYVSLGKAHDAFVVTPVAEYRVDVVAGTIEERILDEGVSVHAAHAVSPVHEGVRPGTYVPLRG
jgi:hypothetical protein